jgi:hypothetical protein
MSTVNANGTEGKDVDSGVYALIEFPKGDFNDYYYTRQIWMALSHVRLILVPHGLSFRIS